MAIGKGLVLATLVIQALAFPAEPPQPQNPENWSIMGFRRICAEEQSACEYSFLISEDPTKAPKYCDFAIDAADGLSGYQTDFAVVRCPDAPEYTINGGWDERGFVTLTVINDQRNLLSFFAFKDTELWAGIEATPHSSKVFIYPMPAKRQVEEKREGKDKEKTKTGQGNHSEREKKEEGLAYASEWKLIDVVRYEFNVGPFTDKLIMMFGIQSGDSAIEACQIKVPLFEGHRALGKSFSHQRCNHGGWSASWGHNETTGIAVMTLTNENKDRRAYFGFTEVNTHVLLGNNGPSPVYTMEM